MLTENEVVDAVCKYLKSGGYSDICHKNTKEQGIDIEATSPDGSKLYIEAKGETSSNPNSKRSGKAFNNNQVFDHIAKAVYTALKLRENTHEKIGIALPVEANHKKHVNFIRQTLRDLDINLFWVDNNSNVKPE
ncbi:hypothetical protein J4419_00865 [Candidatus Woesearchaeota archaeon]|nr:hypothetical protein [Candidatus Woesearchaeota archaeon]